MAPIMSNEFIVLLVLILLGFAVLVFFVRKWLNDFQEKQKPDRLLGDLIKSFDIRAHEQAREIREQSRMLNERLDNAARVISAVQKNIGEFSEIGRSMKNLQEFLQSPKLRGNIGEEILGDLIAQMFPKNSFFLQYTFKSGARVDAAIKTDGGILTIDAKFPMENFVKMSNAENEAERKLFEKEFIRDLKKHIDDISQKYILPDEGTLDFSLMYVPSESVFYELAQITEVMNYARRSRVYPVSPTTLYAHLQTILLSLAGKQLEVKTKSIFKMLRSMLGDYEKIEGSMGVLGKHLTNAYNQMSAVTQSFTLLGQKLKSSQSLEIKGEQEKLFES